MENPFYPARPGWASDRGFERAVKTRLRGEAYLVRYIDDFVVCFQYREDALRVQEVLRKRLGKYDLTLEPSKANLVEFGRFAQRHAPKRGRKRPETIYFLGFTLYCTRDRKGNFKVGMRTEKSRLQRSISRLRDLMRRMRHLPVRNRPSTSTGCCGAAAPTTASTGTSAPCRKCIGSGRGTGARC
jgi:hypothetical protein